MWAPMQPTTKILHRFRSFVGRNGRQTTAQVHAYQTLLPVYGLRLQDGFVDFQKLFGNTHPCFLEIGFGLGQSLLTVAKNHPEWNFIGVETHKPGIGAVLLGIEQQQLNNLKVFNHDVVEVLEQCIPANSLSGVQIFFPDPWPKRRHHPRRLIQPDFIQLLISKLQPAGELHLATDFEDYALQMMKVLSEQSALSNLAGECTFANRSMFRPIQTKFERRALRAGVPIRELQFRKDQ